MTSKLKIVTIHKGNILELIKTINSVLSQNRYPDEYHIISPKLPAFFCERYKYKFMKFFIGKDKSLYNAMNIGLKKTLKMNLMYLNSGDIFYDRNCVKQILENLKIRPSRIYVYKVVLKYNKILFYPKFNYFYNKKYSPHPGFIRPPVIFESKNFKFKEEYLSISDSFWMKEYLKLFKVNKVKKNLIIHNLGGVSTKPNIRLILEKKNLSLTNLLKEFIKFLIFKIISKDLFYRVLYFTRFNLKRTN